MFVWEYKVGQVDGLGLPEGGHCRLAEEADHQSEEPHSCQYD